VFAEHANSLALMIHTAAQPSHDCEQIAGHELRWEYSDRNRIGDHRWWISDLGPFKADYPEWEITYDVETVLREIYEHNAELWLAAR
jgi:CDP-paratose 2-epimerase